ncbi:leucine-rich repeat protein, putative [Bodo saltans]|uniref:Leucine-rich repeat protein, putative n=1 Tax=Bodo saltans TaxID=75058 RepID=A0A0S4IL55_BODSA|nr:leucine-rich repeat protein, putative [Bodo saltans]|eukprot:CUE70436.1 leucine-rich repeat protein, putative [Bodo saltans]
MLSVKDCLELPSPTEGHNPFAHYYLPHLRAAVPTDGHSYEMRIIRFVGRDMTDADCSQIAEAIMTSFDMYGAESCSATNLREIGLSENLSVTSNGISVLLRGLLYVARFGKPGRDAVDAYQDSDLPRDGRNDGLEVLRNPLHRLHTLDLEFLGQDALPLTIENQELLMQIVRAVPGLTTVKIPQSLEVPAAPPVATDAIAEAPGAVVEGDASAATSASPNPFEAEERAEREHLAMLEAQPGASFKIRPSYDAADFQRNAELNEFPSVLKRLVLAAGRSNARVRKARLLHGMEPDDIEREFPKAWGLRATAALRNVLAFNVSIVIVDFSNNNIGDAATEVLAEFLKTNQTVGELNLRNNSIGTKGGLALNRALVDGKNKTLIELGLEDNNISDAVVHAFLDTVKLGVTAIGVLHLERNCVTASLVTQLYHSLMLNTQPAELKKLVTLFEKNDPRGVKFVMNSGEDHLDDTSIKVLLHSLRSNTNLTLIDVSNNELTDQGAFFLSEIMIGVPSLRKVIAQFNQIGEEGARMMLKAIPRSQYIERVDVKFQEPPLDMHLLQLMEKVAGLSNQPKPVRENGLALTENDSDVVSLDLSFADATGKRCDDETISTLDVLLQHNTFLVDLNLSCNAGRITMKSIPTIAKLGLRLQILNLSGNELTDADVIDYLPAMMASPICRLHTLILDVNSLTDVSCKVFIATIRNENDHITTLSLAGNRKVSKESKEQLQFYCDLNTHSKAFKSIVLTIEENRDKRIQAIDFCNVDRLNANGTSHGFRKEFGDLSAKLLCHALAQNDMIKTLNMCGNRITDVGVGYFSRLLRTNVTLTHLDLSYNEITDEGLKEMCNALRHNTTVKVFVFNGNPGKNPEVGKSLQQALQANTISIGTAYTAAMNMTGRGAENGVDPKLQQFAIDRMVGNAILEDALLNLQHPPKRNHRDDEVDP